VHGVQTRSIKAGDVGEVQRLNCFLENARRHFSQRHFPGQQYIKLSSVGELQAVDVRETMHLENKMDRVSDCVLSSIETMRRNHEALSANQAKIAQTQTDMTKMRNALQALGAAAGLKGENGWLCDLVCCSVSGTP